MALLAYSVFPREMRLKKPVDLIRYNLVNISLKIGFSKLASTIIYFPQNGCVIIIHDVYIVVFALGTRPNNACFVMELIKMQQHGGMPRSSTARGGI